MPIKMTSAMTTMASSTNPPEMIGFAWANRGVRVMVFFSWVLVPRLCCLDVKLRADDASNLDKLAGGDGGAAFFARRRRIARAALDVGDFADALLRDRGDDRRRQSGQAAHFGFTRALGFAEQLPERPQDTRRGDEAARQGQRRADKRLSRRLDVMKNDPEPAERSHERGDHRRTKGRHPGHVAGLHSRLRVAAAAVHVAVPAKDVAEDGAAQRKNETHSKTDQVNKKVHKPCSISAVPRVKARSAGQASRKAPRHAPPRHRAGLGIAPPE